MTNPSIVDGSRRKNGMLSSALAALTPMAPHRTGFRSALRSEAPDSERRQPQDGASPLRAKLATITAHLQNDFQEPEDARLTGGTRSLKRRLLGLNFGTKLRKVPVVAAGKIVQPKVA